MLRGAVSGGGLVNKLFGNFRRTIMTEASSVHEFQVVDASGAEVGMSRYEGKPLLVLNTASL